MMKAIPITVFAHARRPLFNSCMYIRLFELRRLGDPPMNGLECSENVPLHFLEVVPQLV